MDMRSVRRLKCAEEMIFCMLSSPLRPVIERIGAKYGLGREDMRIAILQWCECTFECSDKRRCPCLRDKN